MKWTYFGLRVCIQMSLAIRKTLISISDVLSVPNYTRCARVDELFDFLAHTAKRVVSARKQSPTYASTTFFVPITLTLWKMEFCESERRTPSCPLVASGDAVCITVTEISTKCKGLESYRYRLP
jgi:hypothetical protein